MNKQLDQLLKEASYYTPSKRVTLGADQTKSLTFTGLNNKSFGVNRILPGGMGLDHITATIAFNNGRDKRIEDVSLGALRNLFLSRSLRGAIEIERGTKVNVELTNNDSEEHSAILSLVGYDKAHLQQKKESYNKNNVPFPKPEFVYITETVESGIKERRLRVNLPSYKLRLYRMAVSTTGTEEEIRLAVRQGQTRIKPEVYLPQINDEFRDMDIILPQTLQANTPFDLFVTNSGPSSHYISFIAECYKL